MASRFQPVPITPPSPTVAVISGSVSTKTGTKYVWLQTRNRAGYSQVSASPWTGTVNASEGLTLTVPAGARPTPNGADIRRFVFLMSEDSDPLNACVVAEVDGYEIDGVTPKTLPQSVNITTDEHFKLSQHVANVAALPASPVRGTHRQLDDTSVIVRYNGSQWESAKPQAFNTYVTSVSSQYGSAADLSIILSDQVLTESYDTDSAVDSVPVGYAVVNDGDTTLTKGTLIGLSVTLDGEDVSSSFASSGGIFLTFIGFVDTTTGVLDTSGEGGVGTMAGVGVEVPYLGQRTGLRLLKDLPSGSSYVFQVKINLTTAQLGYRGTYGSNLEFAPYFYADRADRSPGGFLFGSFISNDGGKRRIVPVTGLEARALDGTGQIVLPGGYSYVFSGVAAQPVLSLTANTANQRVAININGACLIDSTAPNSSSLLRAIVGTLNTVSKPTSWEGSLSLNSSTLAKVTVTYPTAIRSDYPDVIAGSTSGVFNPSYVRIYIRPVGGGDVLQFEGSITPGVASQIFTVGGVAGTNIGSGALPTRASADLCPYEPTTTDFTETTDTGSSTFSAGTYEVAIAFRYANTVTSINHLDPDCIDEASLSIADIYAAMKYWGEGVTTFTDLAALDPSVVYDMQSRPVIDEHQIYIYRSATDAWEVTNSIQVLDTLDDLRAIPAPFPEGKQYRVKEIERYTRYDSSLLGAETGNGIIKPSNLLTSEAGRHVVMDV